MVAKFDLNDDSVVVIIGTGAGGGVLANELAQKGVGIVVISSELPEVIGLCDRVLVMHEGASRGILKGSEITEEAAIRRASGI